MQSDQTPRRKSQQDQSSPYLKTHEELVADFRTAIRDRKDASISPEELLHNELVNQRHSSSIGDQRAKFFERLEEAWEALICDRLAPGSAIKRKVDGGLQVSYIKYKKTGPGNAPQSILSLNGAQVRTLDAMAEAVGINRPRGQNRIRVPDKYAEPWKL